MKVVLYPGVAARPRVRQMFVGVKRVTVPGQAMSLKEMFRRFVRREPLPVEKKGTYLESDYDLEKVSTMDRVEQEEVLAEMRSKTEAAEGRVKAARKKVADDLKKAEEEFKAKSQLEQKDPKGDQPLKNPAP